jgi:phosphoglycerate dehydrogenase-like enzyme
LFRKADFIALHVPSLSHIKALVSRELMGMMKEIAFLGNTLCGKVVDEPAMIDLLQNILMKGAVLPLMFSGKNYFGKIIS